MSSSADGGDLTLAELAGQVQRVRDTLAVHQTRLAAHKGWLDRHDGQVKDLTAALAELVARFEKLAGTVADALDAAAPAGPAVPRWDDAVPADVRDRQLAELRAWVDGVVVRDFVTGGGYTLARCWWQHRQALWELGALHADWRHFCEKERPGPKTKALEFFDRWLPGVMRRVADATANCNISHIGP